MTGLILVSMHNASCKEEENDWLDYQSHMSRELRFVKERSMPHTFTVTKLRTYPDGLGDASLGGWWIDNQAAIDLEWCFTS